MTQLTGCGMTGMELMTRSSQQRVEDTTPTSTLILRSLQYVIH